MHVSNEHKKWEAAKSNWEVRDHLLKKAEALQNGEQEEKQPKQQTTKTAGSTYSVEGLERVEKEGPDHDMAQFASMMRRCLEWSKG